MPAVTGSDKQAGVVATDQTYIRAAQTVVDWLLEQVPRTLTAPLHQLDRHLYESLIAISAADGDLLESIRRLEHLGAPTEIDSDEWEAKVEELKERTQ